MLGAPSISYELKEIDRLNEPMKGSTWSSEPEDFTFLSFNMNDCEVSRKRDIDDTHSISQRLEKRQRRIASLQEETVCLIKNGRILGEIKPDQSIENTWKEEENGVLLFNEGQCEWKELTGLITIKRIHERSSSHSLHPPYSLKQEDLKRLCSRYCSLPSSSSSSLQYLSTLSFPTSSTVENTPVLKVTPQSIESGK